MADNKDKAPETTPKKEKVHNNWPNMDENQQVVFWWNGTGEKDSHENKKYRMTVKDANQFLHDEYKRLGKKHKMPSYEKGNQDN